MKTLVTLTFALLASFTTLAQDANTTEKPATVEIGFSNQVEDKAPLLDASGLEKESEIVRLYRYKNSRVRKALSFVTKKNRPKLT